MSLGLITSSNDLPLNVWALKDLQLDDLAKDGCKHTQVFVSLSLQKVIASP